MAKLLKWKVEDAPTGRYRSFHQRGWPSATYAGTTSYAGKIQSETHYTPKRAKDGVHAPLKILVCDYSGGGGPFHWRILKGEFKTLDEAKDRLTDFLTKHPNFMPKKEG